MATRLGKITSGFKTIAQKTAGNVRYGVGSATKGIFNTVIAPAQAIANFMQQDPMGNPTFGTGPGGAIKQTNLYQSLKPIKAPPQVTLTGTTLTPNGIQYTYSNGRVSNQPMQDGAPPFTGPVRYTGPVQSQAVAAAMGTAPAVGAPNNLPPTPGTVGSADTSILGTSGFTFADGSGIDAQGKAFTSPTISGAVQGASPANLPTPATSNVNIDPSPQMSSGTVANPVTSADVNSAMKTNTGFQDSLLGKIQGYIGTLESSITGLTTPSDQETKLKNDYTNAVNSYNSSFNKINDKPIAMDFVTGQQEALQRTYGTQIQALANLYNAENTSRKDKLEAAKTLYDTARNSLQDTLSIYKATSPENLGVKVNDLTGDVYVVTRNPITNEIAMQKAGNVGAQPKAGSYDITEIGNSTDVFGNTTKQYGLFNKNTGELTPISGQGGNGSTTPSPFGDFGGTGAASYDYTGNVQFKPSTQKAGTMRTDRNNNPTAMTTDVARSLGLVEGQDYIVGDKFPGSSNLYTAKLLGDPVQQTIKALNNAAQSPNSSAFYTQGGKQRWTYIGLTDQQWLGMSPEQKVQTVATMYQHEGGSGELLASAHNSAGSAVLASSGSGTGSDVQFSPQELMNAAFNLKYTSNQDRQITATRIAQMLSQGDTTGAQKVVMDKALALASAGEREKIDTLKTMSDLSARVLSYAQDGTLEGVGAAGIGTAKGLLRKVGIGGDNSETVRQLIGNIRGTLQKARAGTALTPTEVASLNQYTPSLNDTGKNNVLKLQNLMDYARSEYQNTIFTLTGLDASKGGGGNVESLRQKYGY